MCRRMEVRLLLKRRVQVDGLDLVNMAAEMVGVLQMSEWEG